MIDAMRKITRLGALCLGILAASTLLGGFFGARVLAGGSRLSDHLRLYTAIVGAVEEEYAEEVKSDRLVAVLHPRDAADARPPLQLPRRRKEYTSLQERQKGSYYGLGHHRAVRGRQHHRGLALRGHAGAPPGDPGRRRHQPHRGARTPAGMSIDDAVKRLRGPKGTPVRITIVRQGYDTAPGVHGHPRRDPAALRALLLHGQQERRATSASRTSTRPRPAGPAKAKDCERELEKAMRSAAEERAPPRSSWTSATTPAGCSTRPSRSRTSS